MENKKPILKIEKLTKFFPINEGLFFNRATRFVHAVDDVSFDIFEGETFGLVGESGCGKSTTGRTILQLYRPTSGKVLFRDEDLATLKGEKLRKKRREIQMIFQDPYASLNPRMTVGNIVGEPIEIHNLYKGIERVERVKELLSLVGLDPSFINRYPHEFSGGQRQRIGIARVLSLEPELIICDEPISALDVSIQAQVINLLKDLQERMGLTYLFIAHDLSMVRHMSDRIAVMYLGIIVELASCSDLYSHPFHPYTQALLSAVPYPDPNIEENRKRIILDGDVPSPINPPSGCRFRTRCRYSKEICSIQKPEFNEFEKGHFVACHFPIM